MKAFILALQFLTKLPLPWIIQGEDDLFARGMKYFPAAGLLIGLLDLLVFWLAGHWFAASATALLVVIADTFITGGLHMDGLADTVDALSSHRSRDRMLEIMKDSRIGTFGVLGLLAVLSIKWCMYTSLAACAASFSWYHWGLVTAIPVISRMVMAILIFISEYARKEGMGGLFFAYKTSMNLPAAILMGILFSLVCGRYAVVLLVLGTVVGLLFRKYCYSKIGGMTGDTLGASLEITETVLVSTAVLLIQYM